MLEDFPPEICCWERNPVDRPNFSSIREYLMSSPLQLMKASQDFKETDKENNSLSIDKGDTIAVIEGNPESYWWRGQNLRTFLIGKFPRCSVNPMRPKQPDDISKPLENSFIHTGHGDPYGKSWGNPATIEDLSFRKSKNTSDSSCSSSFINFTSPLSDRKKKHHPKSALSANKQFNYSKLKNENSNATKQNNDNVSRCSSVTSLPMNQNDEILVDVSPPSDIKCNGFSTSADAFSLRSASTVSILDLPIPGEESNNIFANEQFTPPRIYNNLPALGYEKTLNGEPDPFDTSHISDPPSFRYYSQVTDNEYGRAKYCNLEMEKNNTQNCSPIVLPNDFEDSYKELLENNVPSPIKKIDTKFISELEKNLGVKEANANSSFPTLKPPPQSTKSSLKKQANFVAYSSDKTNPKMNTWSAKTTNVQAELQRPASMFMPSDLGNGSNLSTTLSVENLNTLIRPNERYSNGVEESETLFSQMWITEQQSIKSNNSNDSNICKNTSSKCEKTPFNTELMSMLTKSTNTSIYKNSNIYCNTNTVNDELYRYDVNLSNGTHRYDISNTSDEITSRYDLSDSIYDQNIYGNASNLYDVVPEEDLYSSSRQKNIYDSVADESNYYSFIEEGGHSNYTANGASNADSIEKINWLKIEMAGNAEEDECIEALNLTNWDVLSACHHIKLQKLYRLGLASKHRCQIALEESNWNVEIAASKIVDMMKTD